ncbi:hypothetical protein, partial [Phycicoccus sp. CSK15P-2]|uniref:hypothetical protein n=1 Tax=Phycicoccus sp. CSK15P-2 TaxID=2807627 RepID=UPI0019504B87
MSFAVPPGAVPAGERSPLEWLSSWFAQRPAWAGGSPLQLPTSREGDGAGPGGYAPFSRTRASGGAGEAQPLVDGLPGLATGPEVEGQQPGTPTRPRFDPKTSKRNAKASRATMTVYDNADGSRSAELTTVPTNYRAEDGTWQPIDSTLVRRGGRWEVKRNSLGVGGGPPPPGGGGGGAAPPPPP